MERNGISTLVLKMGHLFDTVNASTLFLKMGRPVDIDFASMMSTAAWEYVDSGLVVGVLRDRLHGYLYFLRWRWHLRRPWRVCRLLPPVAVAPPAAVAMMRLQVGSMIMFACITL